MLYLVGSNTSSTGLIEQPDRVKKSKVSDNVFLIPSDYKEVTKEELQKAFGGGGE